MDELYKTLAWMLKIIFVLIVLVVAYYYAPQDLQNWIIAKAKEIASLFPSVGK